MLQTAEYNIMLTIHQYFNIHSIRVQNISNSSVLQIGTSGHISAQSFNAQSLPYPTTGEPSPEEYEPFLAPLPNPT